MPGYYNLKYLDKQVWVNSEDPDQTVSDQGLRNLPFGCITVWQNHIVQILG